MNEQEEVKAMREQMVEALRPFCSESEKLVASLEERWEERDKQEADFNESEARWVAAFREYHADRTIDLRNN